MPPDTPLWQPDERRIADSNMRRFMDEAASLTGRPFEDYDSLYRWSVDEKEAFWSLLWDHCGVIGQKGERILVDGEDIEKATWFPDARLNFAENLLRRDDEAIAIHFRAEDRVERTMSWKELRRQVACVTGWLAQQGVGPGDRVAGYVANMPEAVVAMLATASLGGIWTSTSPDFGEESVIERFGQTAPAILFAIDGYFYNGKAIDVRQRVEAVQAAIPSIRQTVTIPLAQLEGGGAGIAWQSLIEAGDTAELRFTPRGFNDPLYILYSSGTTGKPKCITHKVGGVLLQHLKEHRLHSDVKPGDRVFYFTTCGWMMWNWLVSALASEACLVLYDGSPFYPSGNVLWDYADAAGITLFGTSAKYIDALKNAGLEPARSHALADLRTLCSTGSVLAPESFDYVYDAIRPDLCLASISGGTDIVSCFVLGCPIRPVWRGESQCRGLGMAVEVFDDAGRPLRGEKGELVCTQTFPSQPAFFWGDPDGEKYHEAYFARFPNCWHHGDYVELTGHDGIIIHGRSDATLNPGGVRIGTAEIYRHVEQLDEVAESIVIGQEWDKDIRIVLFVVLSGPAVLDEALIAKIRNTIREKCSPRHVPAKILQVSAIPRTKSGKIVELAVREVVHGRPVKNLHALANPDALEQYRDRPELQA
ncbi:MAG: acetoacetate--CoA ligase [Gammaproteobacteria bacterium]